MRGAATHVVASRDGLFLVNHCAYERVAEGLFFGVTVLGDEIYCFEAGDEPWARSRLGTIVRFRYAPGVVTDREVCADGLDNGCHQIDFFDGALHVVDTYNQQIVRFDERWQPTVHHPLVPCRYDEGDERYAHVNSLLGVGDSLFLLLSNFVGQRRSEIVEVDLQFRERSRLELTGSGCHDLAQLEDGSFLVCDSPRGGLIDASGHLVTIDALLTRGLSVGTDEIAVGSSMFGARPHRHLLPGFVTFLDRSYRRVARLHLPAAPTQIRRLDGCDLTLSRPRPMVFAAGRTRGSTEAGCEKAH